MNPHIGDSPSDIGDDDALRTFLREHRDVAPPPPPDLEERVMAACRATSTEKTTWFLLKGRQRAALAGAAAGLGTLAAAVLIWISVDNVRTENSWEGAEDVDEFMTMSWDAMYAPPELVAWQEPEPSALEESGR